MCFSAQASFLSAGALSIIGLLSMYIAKDKTTRFIAATPLFFALQQAIEGFNWMAQPMHSTLAVVPTYLYLIFVTLFWPIWTPLAVAMYEPEFWRRVMMYVCLGIGALMGMYYLYALFFFGADATIQGHHLVYTMHHSAPSWQWLIAHALYVFGTVAPFFISSRKHMWLFGAGLLIAYAITFLFYYTAFTSVWCFLAALLSMLSLWIIYTNQQEQMGRY